MFSKWGRAAVGLLLAACGAKGPETAPLGDGAKADSLREPTRMGALVAGAPRLGMIEAGQTVHAWALTVGAPAEVTIETAAVPGGDALDTVLYLYQRGEDGRWGRYLSRDDDGAAPFSRITRALEPGQYRVVVKGYAEEDEGPYQLLAQGFDAGCVFGDRFAALDGESPVTRSTLARPLGADELARLDAKTRAALADGAVRVGLHDAAGRRSFAALVAGDGDGAAGVILPERGASPVARIEDGAILDCRVPAQACLFGATTAELFAGLHLVARDERVLTPATPLEPAEAGQVIAAVDHVDFPTAPEAIAGTDEGEMTVTTFDDPRDGRLYRFYRFYSGDTPIGAAFEGDGDAALARMGDDDLFACARFFD
jgi:hypothetical protein